MLAAVRNGTPGIDGECGGCPVRVTSSVPQPSEEELELLAAVAYQRPPLSRDFLLGRVSEQNLILRDETLCEAKQINLVLGRCATLVDLRAQQDTLAGDNALEIEKLATTGSRARLKSLVTAADKAGA